MSTHIQMSSHAGYSWCGKKLKHFTFFENAERAAINGLFDHRIICNACVTSVVNALLSAVITEGKS